MAVFRGRLAAFVAIPKSHEYEEIASLISSSLEDLNVEEMRSPGDFTPYLLEACIKADFLIADITEANPSTYYAIGASQASQKSVLLLSKENASAPPEISGIKVVQYKPDNVQKISEFLRLFILECPAEVTRHGV